MNDYSEDLSAAVGHVEDCGRNLANGSNCGYDDVLSPALRVISWLKGNDFECESFDEFSSDEFRSSMDSYLLNSQIYNEQPVQPDLRLHHIEQDIFDAVEDMKKALDAHDFRTSLDQATGADHFDLLPYFDLAQVSRASPTQLADFDNFVIPLVWIDDVLNNQETQTSCDIPTQNNVAILGPCEPSHDTGKHIPKNPGYHSDSMLIIRNCDPGNYNFSPLIGSQPIASQKDSCKRFPNENVQSDTKPIRRSSRRKTNSYNEEALLYMNTQQGLLNMFAEKKRKIKKPRKKIKQQNFDLQALAYYFPESLIQNLRNSLPLSDYSNFHEVFKICSSQTFEKT